MIHVMKWYSCDRDSGGWWEGLLDEIIRNSNTVIQRFDRETQRANQRLSSWTCFRPTV